MNISEETIDSFLKGDLNGAELENFNKALGADPKIQQEVSLQQDIVDSIKQYRHNQLKSRLNTIDVSTIPTSSAVSMYLKLAASIGVVALFVGSFALFINKKEDSTLTKNSAEARQSNTVSSTTTTDALKINAPSVYEKPADRKSTIEAASPSVSKQKPVIEKVTTASTDQPESSHSNLPSDEIVDENMSFDSRSEDFSVPTINNSDYSTISASVVKVNIVKEKNLGYRYFDNELYLHGNFSNSTYELFELNNKPSKQLFLYFENNYYELIQGKTKVTNLIPITDKATLSQLAQLREH